MSDSELSIKRKLDAVCNQFEEQWSADAEINFVEYLKQVDRKHGNQLLKMLIEIDIELRKKNGLPVSTVKYSEMGQDAVSHAQNLLDVDIDVTVPPGHTNRSSLDSTETMPPTKSSSIGSQIGPYKLLQQIGEGGMGSVYMAEQEKPVRRRVALKVIRGDMGSKETIARFEAERQALAMMDHQNIAKVLDAGTTETGNPYFVMELVKGIPITRYCDENKLSIEERLELFIPVCKAIQHAHQKGIIHRDLKPSNVLVTLYDGKPVAKVIDFGLAKALEHTTKLTDKTMFTEFGKVVGTIQYMAPEQAEMNALDIDTRTDVYSLGVMLYELLTGSTPLDKNTLNQNALLQVLAIIKEKEPPRPSARLSSTGDAVTGISAQRKIAPTRLHQILRGELDWIVMKALEKDRTRRYDTAVGLANDVERYLNHDVVLARPPSPIYRLRKSLRQVVRNPVVMASGGIFVTLLVAIPLVWILITQFRASDERQAKIDSLVTRLAEGDTANLTRSTLADIAPHWSDLQPKLESWLTAENRKKKLNAHVVFAEFSTVDSEFLRDQVKQGAPREIPVISKALLKTGKVDLDEFWTMASTLGGGREHLNACGFLAIADPENKKWADISIILAHSIADFSTEAELTHWIELLRPVGSQITPGLITAFEQCTSENNDVGSKRIAQCLSEYSNDTEVLTKILVDCSPDGFELILDRIVESPLKAKQALYKFLDREKGLAIGNNSDLAIPQPVIESIHNANGMVQPDFAYCQNLKLESFAGVNTILESHGFRVIRFRPYLFQHENLVCCVWHKNNEQTVCEFNVEKAELLSRHEKMSDDGYVAVEVAGYLASNNDETAHLYSAIWRKAENKYTKIFLGLTSSEAQKFVDDISATYIKTLQSFTNRDVNSGSSHELFSGVVTADEGSSVWWNQTIGGMYQKRLQKNIVDISFVSTKLVESLEDKAARNLAEYNQMLADEDESNDVNALEGRWQVNVYLGNNQQAIDDVTKLIDQYRANLGLEFGRAAAVQLAHRAILFARLGKREEMERDLAETATDEYTFAFTTCYCMYQIGDFSEGDEYLLRLLRLEDSSNRFFHAAQALAVAATIAADKDKEKSAFYAKAAFEMLAELQRKGFNPHWIQREALAKPLLELPGCEKRLKELHLDKSFGCVLTNFPDFESEVCLGDRLSESLLKHKQLVRQGFRIGSLTCKSIDGQIETSSVWQRQYTGETENEKLAQQKARALFALLRLGDKQKAAKHLAYDSDPRHRTYFIHWLQDYRVDPGWEYESLVSIDNPKAKIGILHSLKRQALPEHYFEPAYFKKLKSAVAACLDDPHAGVHSSAKQLTESWKLTANESPRDIYTAREQLNLADLNCDATWFHDRFVGKMVLIPKGNYIVGSIFHFDPNAESNETRREIVLNYDYSIGSNAVTMRQFREFIEAMKQKSTNEFQDKNNWLADTQQRIRFARQVVTTDDCPATKLGKQSVYMFCNWLSEQAGVNKDQWCYYIDPKDGQWKPKLNATSLEGYRLPTADEWEIACRAGTTTRRFFGHSVEFLEHYGWFIGNSENRTRPVGLKLPNDFGLFDMHGNIWELCAKDFVCGAADYDAEAVTARSSLRAKSTYNYNHEGSGIRVARTIRQE